MKFQDCRSCLNQSCFPKYLSKNLDFTISFAYNNSRSIMEICNLWFSTKTLNFRYAFREIAHEHFSSQHHLSLDFMTITLSLRHCTPAVKPINLTINTGAYHQQLQEQCFWKLLDQLWRIRMTLRSICDGPQSNESHSIHLFFHTCLFVFERPTKTGLYEHCQRSEFPGVNKKVWLGKEFAIDHQGRSWSSNAL